MKSIDELVDLSGINLLVFDVDGVIVPGGTEIIETNDKVHMDIKRPPQEFIDYSKQLLSYANVAISSGRSMLTLKSQFIDLLNSRSGNNNFILQAENGGRISYGIEDIDSGHNPDTFAMMLDLRKELKKVRHLNIMGFEPKESMITIFCHDRVPEIDKIVSDYPLYCLWNGKNYDIGDPKITKGTGLKKIESEIKKRTGYYCNSIAIGDSYNDFEMISEAKIGISANRDVVKNADYYVDPIEGKLPGLILAEHLFRIYSKN